MIKTEGNLYDLQEDKTIDKVLQLKKRELIGTFLHFLIFMGKKE